MRESVPGLVQLDPWLEPYVERITQQQERYQTQREELGDLRAFASAHETLGFQFDARANEWTYREWAPGVEGLSLIGDFNGWDRESHPLEKVGDYWEIGLPGDALKHRGRVKVHVPGRGDGLPACLKRVIQEGKTKDFCGQVWCPDSLFQWRHPAPVVEVPLIYEAHVGMGTEALKVGSYRAFAETVLPRIARLGYNTVQLMAVAEHPYYGSFGYHVANFFAPSSRCGTPEDLKYLIDTAHGLGLAVLMDLVHSHAVKNVAEGPALFDPAYFHEHDHPQWDSRLFRYGEREVLRFLLSNVRYWLEEFRFDGFRFDGVTSMLYHHHGNVAFDHYDRYFDSEVNHEAVTYLQLANELIHQINPQAFTIAEDMSGKPGLCRPISDGGVGFDARLAMGVPDFWIKLLKHVPDEEWKMSEIYHTLTNRREGERTIGYAESHDQALVGDKTIAFHLMDAAMYDHMTKGDGNLEIERGMALHKMIRLVTLGLGGEGYLNFMGNEFGHPEWVDFPREGNDWSYHYARRQWSLADDPQLRYGMLEAFDREMIGLVGPSLEESLRPLNLDEENQCLQFARGDLVLAFNFHPERSISGYRFRVPGQGEYQVELSSDAPEFDGLGRALSGSRHPIRDGQVEIYLPSRTALVLRLSA